MKFLHRNLTHNWYIIQFGVDLQAKQLWWEICQVLELDRKSQRDLLILAHTGAHGRAHASRILWKLMSDWALQVPYKDLSHLVSHEVNMARKNLDRPPRLHPDLNWWALSCYTDPPVWMFQWNPLYSGHGYWSFF